MSRTNRNPLFCIFDTCASHTCALWCGSSGQLLDVTGGFQTYITFYDFDSLGGVNGGPRRAIECIMADSTSGSIVMHVNSALTQHAPQEVRVAITLHAMHGSVQLHG